MHNSTHNKIVHERRQSSVNRSTFDLINWPDYKKAQLVYSVSGVLGIYAGALLATTGLIFLDDFSGDLNASAWSQATLASFVYGLVSLLFAWYGKNITETTRSKWYIHLSLIMFMLGNVLALVYVGTFTIVAGVVMSGAPMIGMLLYNKNAVIIPLIIGINMSMAWFMLSYLGIIEYSAILNRSEYRHNSSAWLFVNLGATIPQTASIFYIAWVYVDLWKSREKEALYLSRTDPLTQIANRRYFISRYTDELALSVKMQRPISLLMMDLDHFKNINDTYNHQVGDFALSSIVNCMKEHLPEDYLISRHGGEEFCIMMPNTPLDMACKHADRLREVLESQSFEYSHKGEIITLNMTISIGVSHWSPDLPVPCVTQMLSDADHALYQAKNNGRNQVFCTACHDSTSAKAC